MVHSKEDGDFHFLCETAPESSQEIAIACEETWKNSNKYTFIHL